MNKDVVASQGQTRNFANATSRLAWTVPVFLLGLSQPALMAEAPLGKQWPVSRQISIDHINHSYFDALLKKYVDSDGYVDYRRWKNSPTDRERLIQYLAHLSRASTSLRASRSAQLAFWINAYNAVTIEGILQKYPTSSIRNHTAQLFGYNIWKDLPLLVGGKPYSLDTIEHAILRKMGEPRIHFAIVCASVGCPRLRNEAYTSQELEQQLEDNARDFFSRKKNLRVDAGSHTLYLSSILDWFGSDFGSSQPAQLKAIRPYLPASAQQLLLGNVRVKFLDYDWSLNDQARKR